MISTINCGNITDVICQTSFQFLKQKLEKNELCLCRQMFENISESILHLPIKILRSNQHTLQKISFFGSWTFLEEEICRDNELWRIKKAMVLELSLSSEKKIFIKVSTGQCSVGKERCEPGL